MEIARVYIPARAPQLYSLEIPPRPAIALDVERAALGARHPLRTAAAWCLVGAGIVGLWAAEIAILATL